jgi:hypothetical protein
MIAARHPSIIVNVRVCSCGVVIRWLDIQELFQMGMQAGAPRSMEPLRRPGQLDLKEFAFSKPEMS